MFCSSTKMTFTFRFSQASFAVIFRISYLGLDSSNGMPLNRACSSYRPSLKASPTACRKQGVNYSKRHVNLVLGNNTRKFITTFDIRRTSMIRGNSFKLLVISTIITQSETVIRIDPPRKEAAPSKAYLKAQARIRIRTVKINSSQ